MGQRLPAKSEEAGPPQLTLENVGMGFSAGSGDMVSGEILGPGSEAGKAVKKRHAFKPLHGLQVGRGCDLRRACVTAWRGKSTVSQVLQRAGRGHPGRPGHRSASRAVGYMGPAGSGGLTAF